MFVGVFLRLCKQYCIEEVGTARKAYIGCDVLILFGADSTFVMVICSRSDLSQEGCAHGSLRINTADEESQKRIVVRKTSCIDEHLARCDALYSWMCVHVASELGKDD